MLEQNSARPAATGFHGILRVKRQTVAQTGNKVASEEGDLGICLRKRRSAEKLVFDEAWFFLNKDGWTCCLDCYIG